MDLAICRELGNLLGAKLAVDHPKDGGKKFLLTHTMDRADLPTATSQPTSHSPGQGSASEAPTPRILLVEDNLTNQVVAKGLIKKIGFEVHVAENGLIGLQMAREGDFALILMDIQMPEMDGLTATRKIREWEKEQGRESGVPIVALTAHALDSDRTACADAGMDYFMSKPVSVQELRKMFRCFLPEHMPTA